MAHSPEFEPRDATVLDGAHREQAEKRKQNKLSALRARLQEKKDQGIDTPKRVYISGADLPKFTDDEIYDLYMMYTREFKDMILLQFDSEKTRRELEADFQSFRKEESAATVKIHTPTPSAEQTGFDSAQLAASVLGPYSQAAARKMQEFNERMLGMLLQFQETRFAETGVTLGELQTEREKMRAAMTAERTSGVTATLEPTTVAVAMVEERELPPEEWAVREIEEQKTRATKAATNSHPALEQILSTHYDENGVARPPEPQSWFGRVTKNIGSRLPWRKKAQPAFS